MKDAATAPATRESTLFRVEAIQHQADAVFGAPLDAAPVAWSVSAFVILLAAISLVSLGVFGTYTQRETVDGYIASTDGDIRVYPQAAGLVSDLRVREGARVSAGDVLFTLLTSRNGAMTAEANLEVHDAILVERQALQLQATEQLHYFKIELARLQISAQNSESGIHSLKRQLSLANAKQELVQRDLRRFEKLGSQGYLAERDQDALAIIAVDSEMLVEATLLRIAEQEASLQDANARISLLAVQHKARLAEIAAVSGQVAQRLTVARASLAQAVTSPVDGHISALHVAVGQAVRPDTLALGIIAERNLVHAELLVPGRSIGMLDKGQSVDLRFDAYPFEKFGVQGATVEQVDRSPLLPGEARFPVAFVEPVFRVRARLHRQSIDIEGEFRRLAPGLTFKADILHSERTLIEWLLAPVIGAARRI
jgi:membrane fusion protein